MIRGVATRPLFEKKTEKERKLFDNIVIKDLNLHGFKIVTVVEDGTKDSRHRAVYRAVIPEELEEFYKDIRKPFVLINYDWNIGQVIRGFIPNGLGVTVAKKAFGGFESATIGEMPTREAELREYNVARLKWQIECNQRDIWRRNEWIKNSEEAIRARQNHIVENMLEKRGFEANIENLLKEAKELGIAPEEIDQVANKEA